MSISKAAAGALLAGGLAVFGSAYAISNDLLGNSMRLQDFYVGFQVESELYETLLNMRYAASLTPEGIDRYNTLKSRYESLKDTGDFRAAKAQVRLYKEADRTCDKYKLAGFWMSMIGGLGLAATYVLSADYGAKTAEDTA